MPAHVRMFCLHLIRPQAAPQSRSTEPTSEARRLANSTCHTARRRRTSLQRGDEMADLVSPKEGPPRVTHRSTLKLQGASDSIPKADSAKGDSRDSSQVVHTTQAVRTADRGAAQ